MLRLVKKHWPILAASGVLSGLVLILLSISIKQNEGHFVYALDDAYIHMAMAKNLAQHGVWGVTRYAFSPSTSSILWTLILSLCYLVFGNHETIPFILNLIFALLVLVASYRILDQYSLARPYQFLLLLCLTFFIPLPVVIFVGMEHSAQILIDILFVYQAARVLAKPRLDFAERDSLRLLALSALVPLIRYEGLFLISVVCLLLIARGRLREAFASGAAALIPLAVFGFISVREGAFWLPNSVLLKGASPAQGLAVLLAHALSQLKAAPYLWQLLVLAAGLSLIRMREKGIMESGQAWLFIFIFTTLLHVTFSLVVVWFFRYEAYLIALGLLACGVVVREALNAQVLRERRAGPLITLAVFLLVITVNLVSLARRSIVSLRRTPQATTNIYQQQYQMAMFLRSYYEGGAIAANDIGAINYFADIECLDLWGLASTEVARAKRQGKYDTALISQLAESRRTKIAIAYDSWLKPYGGAPLNWQPAGHWKIQNNVVLADAEVSFYAVNPAETLKLLENLRAFSTQLPAGVVQSGIVFDFPRGEPERRIDARLPEAEQYLWQGWSGREACCRWSNSNRAAIVFSLDQPKRSVLEMKLAPFLIHGQLSVQHVSLELNGQPLTMLELGEAEPKVYSVLLPENLLRDKNVLGFKLPDAASPSSLKVGEDARQLAINLEWFEIKTDTGGR